MYHLIKIRFTNHFQCYFMDALQQDIQGFTFYSLKQCTHQQLLSHSKYPVNIYHRTQTNQIFVVKQIPYNDNLIKLYRILKDSQTLNIVQIYGLTRLTLVKQKQQRRLNKIIIAQNQQLSEHFNSKINKSNMYLLIWMQKCQKTLVDYVQQRRKKLNSFSANQVKSFLFQMLTTLRILQKKGISHRDIKPQNILIYQNNLQNRFFLCDFDEAILTKWGNVEKKPQQIMAQLQYTTILYSTPKFLKAIKQNKLSQKYFDPYKMDVYAFGLTMLYFCSLGKFSIDDRHIYLYNSSQTHSEFIEEERRKFIKKDPELKIFNNIIKLMLEEDQYKRDDFQTLNQKIINLLGIQDQSEQSMSTKSVKNRRQNREKLRKSHGKGFVCGKLKAPQKFILSVFLLTILIYFFLLIF